MSAPKGNKFWMARSSHGANPKFEHANDLWDACLEYFAWVEDNPLYESRLVSFQGISKVEQVAKMRAMTITGLCTFLDISESTWYEWKAKRKDLSEILARVDQIIRTQKFEGASAELLNPNIIARDLGLADKRDNTSSDGTMTPKAALDVSKLTTKELGSLVELLDKAQEGDAE